MRSAGASERSHAIDFIFPLALLLTFALSALVVVLFAARVYKGSVETSDIISDSSTATAYIFEKVHQQGPDGQVYVSEFGDGPALVLEDSSENGSFQTIIYSYKGFLREIYMISGAKAAPSSGNKILKVENFEVEEISENIFKITCTCRGGNVSEQIISGGAVSEKTILKDSTPAQMNAENVVAEDMVSGEFALKKGNSGEVIPENMVSGGAK